MQIVDVREFEESFVIHFGSEFKRINAYTLASALVSMADAIKEANHIVNPGYEVEVVVEALQDGSFKAKIKTIYKGINNLFSKNNLKTIALGIISAYVYQNTLAPETQINVKVDDNLVIIQQGDKQIIVPRDVHEALKEVEKSTKFKQDVSRTFLAVEKDEEIKSVGITKSMDDRKPPFDIPRARFPLLSEPDENEGPTRQIIEMAKLEILRAILERSRRRWEFVWRGIKISAPVLDQVFYNDFFAHRITIAPGDSLEVRLKIYQRRDQDTGIYTNDKYEVTEVLNHLPRPEQTSFQLKDI